ncbi:unnamed protein product [Rhodiola kirilowii]
MMRTTRFRLQSQARSGLSSPNQIELLRKRVGYDVKESYSSLEESFSQMRTARWCTMEETLMLFI